jgi:hypothetical protein
MTDKTTHKPGCEALGGYGHGIGPCSCSEAQPEALWLADALHSESDRQSTGVKYSTAKKSATELRRQHAEIQQLKAQQNELREEQRLCMLEASGLAISMFKKHFSHERHYASGEVVWGLCDNLRGVISQIDNMASGLVRPEAQLSARQAAPDWIEDLAQSWDECMYDAPGEMIDIGASIRKAASRAAPPPPEREPLSETQVRGLLESAGYWPGEDSQRADFINGLRYGEIAHGIGAAND